MNRSSFLLPLAILIALLLLLSLGTAGAQPPAPAPDPFAVAAAQPADVVVGDGVTRLAPPAGCTLFEGASPSSAEDATGAIYWSAFSQCGGIWGARVFRFAGGASSVVALPGGVMPRARGILSLERNGLYLTGWDNKTVWRIVVPGAQPFPPIMVQSRLVFPLADQH
jgi:hypothetical protein